MGKKTKKPGKGKEKTEKKTAKAEEKKARRETKKLSPEDDIDAILVLSLFPFTSLFHSQTNSSNKIVYICVSWIAQLSIQKEEAKKKDVQVDDNVPAPSPRSNCSVTPLTPLLTFSPLTVAISVLTPSCVAHR